MLVRKSDHDLVSPTKCVSMTATIKWRSKERKKEKKKNNTIAMKVDVEKSAESITNEWPRRSIWTVAEVT